MSTRTQLAEQWGLTEEQSIALKLTPTSPVRTGLGALFAAAQKGEYVEMAADNMDPYSRAFKAGRMAALMEFESLLESIFES